MRDDRAILRLAGSVLVMAAVVGWFGSAAGQSAAPAAPTPPAGVTTSDSAKAAPVPAEEDKKLGITAAGAYMSKYVWRGYEVFGSKPAFQPSVTADLFKTGFSANVWGSFPLGSGFEELTELDYTLAYAKSLFEDQRYQVDLGLNYIYYDYPKANDFADAQEVGMSVAFPKLIPIGETALVPKYYYGQLWPTKSGVGYDVAGDVHVFGLGFNPKIPGLDQEVDFSWDITYNDGIFGADHDWSHTTFGVGVPVALGPVTVTPCLCYQISMDKSVNDDDVVYGGVTASIGF